MADLNCDDVRISVPDEQVAVVRGWIDRRDAQIKEKDTQIDEFKVEVKGLKAELEKLQTQNDAMKKTCDMFPMKVGDKSYDSPMALMEFLETLINEKEMMAEDKSKLQGRCDALEEQLKSAPKINMDAVNERIKLQKQAYPFMVRASSQFNEDDFAGMSDQQIKATVVKIAFPNLDTSNRDEATINGMFEVACQAPPQLDSTVPLSNALGKIVSVSNADALDVANAERNAEIDNGWKQFLNS